MEQDFKSFHEQNVTKGLVLSEKAEIRGLIPMTELMLLVVSGYIFMAIAKPSQSIAYTVMIIAFAVIAISSIPAIRAFKVLSSFAKENKRAYEEGQQWRKEQSYGDKWIFNNNATVVKRIYSKRG